MGKFQQLLRQKVVILDGATGTNLLGKGLAPGESPSILNVRNEDTVLELHKAYAEVGADVILTNTFSANGHSFTKPMLGRVIRHGVALAKRAAKKRMVLGDVGPLGEFIEPYGTKTFEEALKDYRAIFRIFSSTGLKKFFIETMTSIVEAKAAFLAAQEYASDIFICFSLQDNGRTIMGDIPESIALTFEALGARGVGINCTAPEVVVQAIAKMARVTSLPLIAKPNAGQVQIENEHVHHTMSDAQLAAYYVKFVRAGANMVGGCCGTSPLYTEEIAKKRVKPIRKGVRKAFYLTTPGRILNVEENKPVVVGERLNPSGRKKLGARLKKKDYRIYGEEALQQENAGAAALDVNAFVAVLNEYDTLPRAVHEVLKNSSLPLFIDTLDFKAAETVLRFYPGLGVYNSIPARRKELAKWLPMIRRYGFKPVISLIGDKIPQTIRERMRNAKLAVSMARKIDFPVDDLIFDPLVFPIATEKEQMNSTLETLSRLHDMGLKTILGVSNVSYGLPDRSLLNAALVTAAVKNHVTFLILNPLDEVVMGALNASDALFSGGLTTYIENYRKRIQEPEPKRKTLRHAIVCGDVESGVELAKGLLDSGIDAKELIENHVVKALEIVGKNYEEGKFFIPDLLKAAEVAQSILGLMSRHMPRQAKRGKIVIATVKGDIHDIGKNLAAMVFESVGYEVIDLGKDVTSRAIVDSVRKHNPDFLGLSALLTTTMVEMENVIDALQHAGLNVKVIIGGPNVSARYAKKIGAYGAAQTVFEGLGLLRNQNSATR